MWTAGSLLSPGIAIARPRRPSTSWWTPETPQRVPLVSGHLDRLNKPVPSEFRRTESSSPDLCSQRVGSDPKLRGGFPEGQEGHIEGLVQLVYSSACSYASRYVMGMPDPWAERAPRNGATSGCDQMFGMVTDNR